MYGTIVQWYDCVAIIFIYLYSVMLLVLSFQVVINTQYMNLYVCLYVHLMNVVKLIIFACSVVDKTVL